MKQFLKTCLPVGRFLLLLLLTLSSGDLYAQLRGQALLDSMISELPKAKEDSNKVKLLNRLVNTYRFNSGDSGIVFARQAIALSERLQWKKGIAISNIGLARCYTHKSDYQKALEYNLTALKYAEEEGLKTIVANIAENIGSLYETQSDYTTAMAYYTKYMSIAEEVGDKDMLARAVGDIGGIFYTQQDYPKSLDYFFKAIKIFDDIGNRRDAAWYSTQAADVYEAQKDYAKALEMNSNALKTSREIGFGFGMALASKNISKVYKSLKNYTEAVSYARDALERCEEIGDNSFTAAALSNIGEIYVALAEAAGSKSNDMDNSGELPVREYIPDVSVPAGRSARLDLAFKYLKRGLDTAEKIKALDVVSDCYESLARAYKLSGNLKDAMDCYQKHVAVKDSVFSQKKATQIAQLEMQKKIQADSLKSEQARHVAELKYRQQRNYTYLGIAGILALMGFSLFVVRNRKKLGDEKKRSDDLLLNILPEEVATELKTTGTTTAKHFDHVTVLFTDFANFTHSAERMSPQNLIDELHICFKKFDEITGRHNVEKIKTIGDAYLAVSGLPTKDARHAENVVHAATEINAFMQDRLAKLGNSTFEVRIGIHSGSVVAGIVGVKKFAYDIWGDTVNTAARMEQNCEAGKINISQTTYELVKDKFNCEYRGEIDAKGKGMLKMYYVSASGDSA